MPETISPVSDGGDVVTERRGEPVAQKRIAIQYLGFQDADGEREYLFHAQRGDRADRYTVSIERTAFARRQALLQDGPDICYQKLLRELAGSELQVSNRIEVTDRDLEAYRAAHAPPARRGFSPPGPPERTAAAPPDKPGRVA